MRNKRSTLALVLLRFVPGLIVTSSFLSSLLVSIPRLSPHAGRPPTAAPSAATEPFPNAILDAAAAPALHRHGLGDAPILRVREPRNHHARQNGQEAHSLDRAKQTGGARCACVGVRISLFEHMCQLYQHCMHRPHHPNTYLADPCPSGPSWRWTTGRSQRPRDTRRPRARPARHRGPQGGRSRSS